MARKRKAGDGTVRQRKDGRWEGRIVIGYDDNGYPKTKNILAKTKKECVEKLQKLKEECGGLKPEKVRSEMSFGDWLTYWYKNHSKPKIRPTTQETYESRIRLHIIPEIGSIPLNKLTQNDLQQFYGRLKKSGRKRFTDKYGEGLSDRMVRMCHATCRSALEKAVQDGLIRVNPAIGCKLPPKKAREMQVLTREELQRFLMQAKFEGSYEVFLLDLATGLRRGELMALQWDDLNFKTGVLNVNKQVYDVRGQLQISTPKTKNSVRKIVLPPAVVAVLPDLEICLTYGTDGLQHMELNGMDVTAEIRLPEVSRYASLVSAYPEVRAYLLEMQRQLARENSVVMDGRDIGTVVLPDAEVKVFLTASAEERARRRMLELEERGTPEPYAAILRAIQERDWNDTHRDAAPLRQAEDAVLLDTTALDFVQSEDALLHIIRERTGL